MLSKQDKILIAGANGMVGSALKRCFEQEGYHQLLLPSRKELDYRDQQSVRKYLEQKKPTVIVIAAAKVGGIIANLSYPAEFIYDNLLIGCHLVHEAYQANVSRVLYLGSTCIYPKEAEQPIKEDSLLSGSLEKTNEAYSIAKIAILKMCQFYREQYGCHYISAMPTNLYGLNDHYHPKHSHVIPGLMGRFHEAKVKGLKEVVVWGTGKALREFLYVDDLARGCLHLLKYYDEPFPINIGSDQEYSISQLAQKLAEIVGFSGEISYDCSKPDGVFRKKTDTSRLFSMGWRPQVLLDEGLALTYADYQLSLSGRGALK